VLLMQHSRAGEKRALTWAVGLAQFGVLALNAVSRQLVQNLQLEGFVDVVREPVSLQWSPLLSFLLLFVMGLAVIIWMLSKAAAAGRGGFASGAVTEPR
jgi:hypothetical protein